jgi:hypothetical protein
MKRFLFSILAFAPIFFCSAQVNADSLAAETTLSELFTVCNSVVPEGEDAHTIIFERLAPYVLYTGKDAVRDSKAACDYNKVEDRQLVDKTGHALKNWLDVISEYKVVKYQNIKKDNLDWHLVTINYKPLNKGKDKVFGFIKIKGVFLLGKLE